MEASVQLEDNITIPTSPRAITNTDDFIQGLQHSGYGKVRFDWFLTVCNVTPPSYKGTLNASRIMQTWCQHCLTILHVIMQHTTLGSAIIIAPFQYPNFYHIFSKAWKNEPIQGWYLHHRVAEGPKYNAPVNTIHNVIYIGQSRRGPTWTPQGQPAAIKDYLQPPSPLTAYYHIRHNDIRNECDPSTHSIFHTSNPTSSPPRNPSLFPKLPCTFYHQP